jgi:predicted TIM-barrel fold metal-dependent hydrolase
MEQSNDLMIRSRFLRTAALGGIASALAWEAAEAQPSPAGKIDIHHHIVPPVWLAAYEARGRIGDVLGNSPHVAAWTPGASLDQMDRYGIQTAFTSLSTPGIWWGDAKAARELARACNEYAADVARRHAGRFGFFCATPLPDVEGSLRETSYAFDVLGADGVGLLTNYDEKWLGDPGFATFFDELDRRGAVVFVHPTGAPCCAAVVPGISAAAEEYLFDTTRTMTSLVIAGTFARCPNIRFIFGQAGGTMPILAARLARVLESRPEFASGSHRDVLDELRGQYYDVTTSANAPTLAALERFADPARIVFGTDFPYVPIEATDAPLTQGITDPVLLAGIQGGNARRILPRARLAHVPF